MTTEMIADYDGRPVWFCSGQMKDALDVDCQLGPNFTCGFFLFDSAWNEHDLRALVVSMLGGGCVSMMFHGARCEEAHDLADDAFIKGGYVANLGGPEDTLMTTWLEGADLRSGVFDLFCCTSPAVGLVSSGYYVFSFGSDEENARLRRLLSDPSRTIQEAADGERSPASEGIERLNCPACGLAGAFGEPAAWEICSRCGWEDDPIQRRIPDHAGGANKESLRQARELWKSGPKAND